MQQMEQSSHYCSGTSHRTQPLLSAFSIDTHTVRLYCNEVGGETSKKETRTCSGVVIYQPAHTHTQSLYNVYVPHMQLSGTFTFTAVVTVDPTE